MSNARPFVLAGPVDKVLKASFFIFLRWFLGENSKEERCRLFGEIPVAGCKDFLELKRATATKVSKAGC